MSDFSRYMHAQTSTRCAKAEYDAASVRLELACIRERAAELCSQHEPLHTMTGGDKLTRDIINKAIFYVLNGRQQS